MSPGGAAWCAEHHPLVFDAWVDELRKSQAKDKRAGLMDRLKKQIGG